MIRSKESGILVKAFLFLPNLRFYQNLKISLIGTSNLGIDLKNFRLVSRLSL